MCDKKSNVELLLANMTYKNVTMMSCNLVSYGHRFSVAIKSLATQPIVRSVKKVDKFYYSLL